MKFYKERTERIEEMKKKIIIISSIIVCLLIVGGITFFALNKTSKDKTLDVTENLEAETSTHMLKRNLMFLLIRKKLIQKKKPIL